MADRVADLRAALEGALRQKNEAEERGERLAIEMTKREREVGEAVSELLVSGEAFNRSICGPMLLPADTVEGRFQRALATLRTLGLGPKGERAGD